MNVNGIYGTCVYTLPHMYILRRCSIYLHVATVHTYTPILKSSTRAYTCTCTCSSRSVCNYTCHTAAVTQLGIRRGFDESLKWHLLKMFSKFEHFDQGLFPRLNWQKKRVPVADPPKKNVEAVCYINQNEFLQQN